MGWVWMSGAIFLEIAATALLPFTHGLTRGPVTATTAVLYLASYSCLALALRAGIDVSIGYAVWSGLGTAAMAILGAVLFGESLTPFKVAALGLIVGGVALLLSPGPSPDTAGAVSQPSAPAAPADPAPLAIGRRP